MYVYIYIGDVAGGGSEEEEDGGDESVKYEWYQL
jgi:hypothetical protein